MRKIIWVALAVVGSACSSSPPPSCQDAITHYYSSGCQYTDLTTGVVVPEATEISDCQMAAEAAPADCVDTLNAWLECNNGVPAGATTNAQCDCSAELMAIETCH